MRLNEKKTPRRIYKFQLQSTNWMLFLYALFWVIPRGSEFYMPTFRNTLSVPSSWADMYEG